MVNRRIVYSTETGRTCPECGHALAHCQCSKQHTITPSDGVVRLQRQTKGRNGKPVIIITGLPLGPADLKQLAKKLKARCGVGGTIDASNIIIQGDQREVLKSELEALGYTVKLSGG